MVPRVLLLHEPGRAQSSAIEAARSMVEQQHASLTVASVVPQAPSGPRCGGSAREYNTTLRETAVAELARARAALGESAAHATFELLVEGIDPALPEWCAAREFDVILLPARRRPLRSPNHPAAARLSRWTGAEIRIVGRSVR